MLIHASDFQLCDKYGRSLHVGSRVRVDGNPTYKPAHGTVVGYVFNYRAVNAEQGVFEWYLESLNVRTDYGNIRCFTRTCDISLLPTELLTRGLDNA